MIKALKYGAASVFLLSSALAWAAETSGPVFYGDPPDQNHPWAVHDRNRPQPKVVTPGSFSTVEQPGKPPADAIILFDGTDLSKWESGNGGPAQWPIKDGVMTAAKGDIRTKEKFGDCQLHVEWAAPTPARGESQGRGNSGIFLMGRVEIQVLDCYNNPTYADGGAASVYGVNPPMVNALRPPGEFQVYDIIFRRPLYKDGKQVDPGYVTVLVNGVVVQDHTPLEGGTGHMTRSKPGPFPETGPLQLQDHGNPVRYRNIWYRPLPPNTIEGGTDGRLTPEATAAKRKEIAASVRADAASMKNNPVQQMMRLAESLIYEKDEATMQQVQQMGEQYVKSLNALAADQLAGKKGEVQFVQGGFKYLARWKIVAADFAPMVELDKLIRAQGWNRR